MYRLKLIHYYSIKDCVIFLKLECSLLFVVIISYFIVKANGFDENFVDVDSYLLSCHTNKIMI